MTGLRLAWAAWVILTAAEMLLMAMLAAHAAPNPRLRCEIYYLDDSGEMQRRPCGRHDHHVRACTSAVYLPCKTP